MLHELEDRGNTVLPVEHDPDLMRHADWIIDLGPGAGTRAGPDGGRLINQGPTETVAAGSGPTAKYLRALLS